MSEGKDLQDYLSEEFSGMLTINNVQQLINFLGLKISDENRIVTNVVNISNIRNKSDGNYTKSEAIELIKGELPKENGKKLTIEIPILDGSHFYNYRVEIEVCEKSNEEDKSNDKKSNYKITGFEKIDTYDLDKDENQIDERVKELIAGACDLKQTEIEVIKGNSIEKYSDKVKQKQSDGTSCGWYAVAVLNDIVHNKDNNNLGIIGVEEEKERSKSSEKNDKELREKILNKLTLQQVAELYDQYSIENIGKYEKKKDIALLCNILNKENYPNFFNLNINGSEVTVINIRDDFYTIKDNTIYTIKKGENGYKLKKPEKNYNKDVVIKYIKCCCSNNLEDVKNKKLGEIEEIKENTQFKELKNIENIDEFELAQALILQIIKEEKGEKRENKDNIIKNRIRAIPPDLKIAFLKKLAKENNDNEIETWEELRKAYEDDEYYAKVYPFIIEMFEGLNRDGIQQIFDITGDNGFYKELNDYYNNNNYLFRDCFCKTIGNIERIKYELVNNFSEFTQNSSNNYLGNHKIRMHDLKCLLEDKKFIDEFEKNNKEKNVFDIWNVFKTCNAIETKENGENEYIQLNCGEFFVGQNPKGGTIEYNSTDTLLNNEDIVITNAGNKGGKIDGGGINGGCASVYGQYNNNVFELREGENYKEGQQVKLIKKSGNNCCIVKIKKKDEEKDEEKEYTMVYLVGPDFRDGGNDKSKLIDELNNALDNYIEALSNKELGGKTVVFSGISNSIFANNYRNYTTGQDEKRFNIMDFYNALYLESKLKNTKLEYNLFFINGVSHAMEYIESVLQKKKEEKIDLHDLFKTENGTLLDESDSIFEKMSELIRDLGTKEQQFTVNKKQNQRTTVSVSTISNKNIKEAEKEIETKINQKLKEDEVLKEFFKVKGSNTDKKFNKLDIFNSAEYKNDEVSEDTKKACEKIKEICKNIDRDNGEKTDTYIIANAVEDSKTVDEAYKKVLKNEQYKTNHDSMQCTYEKTSCTEGKDKYTLKLEITEGQCEGAKIEFDVPNHLSEMQVLVWIGLYGMNNVINVVSKEGECKIEYQEKTYKNINELEGEDNNLKNKFEFQEENKELKQQLANLSGANELMEKSIKKERSPATIQ